ncbi:MAG: ComEC/Rec2 family competence protein [Deferribacteraceae bacterium]|jgi:competence protein ComEC|nr:ComEC/Rec2 family competence protein [Deferribacteraceae bacterium]
MLKKLRHPYFFLAAAVLASLVALISPVAAIIVAAFVILLFFPLKASIPLAIIYILFQYYSFHTAYVVDIKQSTKTSTIVTTKGWFRETADFSSPDGFRIGDCITAKFPYTIELSGITPRIRYTAPTEFTISRTPFISSLLELRQRESKRMIYLSGGRIHTAPAHIFAVRDQIPTKLQDQYIITGLAHLLAMSGFHVGIFTGGIFLLCFFLPRKLRAIPVILLLPLLIPLSGFVVTVQRSVIFAMISMIAWLLGMRVASVRFLSFLAACLILLKPFSLFSISFLLSFTAVLGIMTMFRKRYTLAKGILVMGIASTVFTLPIQLYFFGTSNVASIITTVIFTPVVWLQMCFGLLAVVFGDVMIAPLVYIELFSEWLMNITSNISWYTLFVAKPPTWLLAISFVVSAVLIFTRFRLLTAAIFLLPLLPVYPDNVLSFPELPPSPKGYILKTDEGTEIFYQGMRSSFVYTMVPAAAELGIRSFDRGSIRIFDGENLYLKIKEEGLSGKVCVNTDTGECEYFYATRSNTIKAPLRESINKYIIYKNKLEDLKILIQDQTGKLMIPL